MADSKSLIALPRQRVAAPDRRRAGIENAQALTDTLQRANYRILAGLAKGVKNPALRRYALWLDAQYLQLDGLLRTTAGAEAETRLAAPVEEETS